MEVKQIKIKVRDLVENYTNLNEEGVFGYNNKLDIRPPYQREFIYNDKQRQLVIDTLKKGFPLNIMYWSVKEDGNFEIIDGQQRTISICDYVHGEFHYKEAYFDNLTLGEQEQILEYPLIVYLCTGTDKEKLEWFEVINIAGEVLTNQELLNAIYSGSWVTDAKKRFSKTRSAAYEIGNDYLKGSAIRQDYLETALKWISKRENVTLRHYMALNQHEPNANALWLYFRDVIEWTKLTFPNYRREMKGVDWGYLYNEFRNDVFDVNSLETEITKLMMDDDVTSKKGIYFYVLKRDEKYLNIRNFSANEKREAYERQQGICPLCENKYSINKMEGDHIMPWSKGGKTEAENCQMLCVPCNRTKSNK